MAKSLNGYWTSKADPDVTVYVEKTFKAGHVTGFKYTNTERGQVIGDFRATHDELQSDYMRVVR